jgi:hypothetical protein
MFLKMKTQISLIIYHLLADIDLTDPEVEAAAAKIQSAFKMRGKKNKI